MGNVVSDMLTVGRHIHHHKVEHPDVWQRGKHTTVNNNEFGHGWVVILRPNGV
jgi:hypothetical protein